MHAATLFLWKGWGFACSTRPCAGAASRPLTLRRMMAKHVNLAVNVAICAALSPCPPAFGAFSHVLAFQLRETWSGSPFAQAAASSVPSGLAAPQFLRCACVQTPFRARAIVHITRVRLRRGSAHRLAHPRKAFLEAGGDGPRAPCRRGHFEAIQRLRRTPGA
jgi:hypothetical protein